MLAWRGIIDSNKIIPPRNRSPISEAELKEFRWILERIGYYHIEGLLSK